MKPRLKTRLALLLGACLLSANAAAGDHFKEWCDAFTAQGLVMLAADRMFGIITTLSKDEMARRTEWVNNAIKLSDQRFKRLTGQEFADINTYVHSDWVPRCQLKEQIN
jgi:hypothetical protein